MLVYVYLCMYIGLYWSMSSSYVFPHNSLVVYLWSHSMDGSHELLVLKQYLVRPKTKSGCIPHAWSGIRVAQLEWMCNIFTSPVIAPANPEVYGQN